MKFDELGSALKRAETTAQSVADTAMHLGDLQKVREK